jgi:putative endonuclease
LKYVYLIQSISNPDQRYVGTTSDVEKRISAHNAGQSPHTSKYRPWKLVISIAFSNTEKATEFERYLKSGSGHAFADRHFWS